MGDRPESSPGRERFDADERVLRELFMHHSEFVFSVARLVTNDNLAAGEITRRVFGQLWHERERLPGAFGGNGAALRWLRAAARRESQAWLRRAGLGAAETEPATHAGAARAGNSR